MAKSPQEKKALSYAKDRRDAYGANNKASRKGIRRRKRQPNRADRRRESQVLGTALGPAVEAAAEAAESRLQATQPKGVSTLWKKWPDQALADHVENRLLRRVRRGMSDPAVEQARIERIRRGLR
ncbi:hypothetical protein SAMN05192558_105211 [Actinokineospora alba]|uniref:Uncharacterized protein n=2 Tax=Actinokineospora alba TaxID=504798 RepID=A0A1H0N5U2_9PSEU|nr:hypothetical protein C8E96_4147 [Actinokineospora alba]SDH82258.1 hypothetical protein SAMN05421871_102261 [Actinokineospora alba]SDO88032.1 hypothetical protein SAMN05192558_105211 [Actinokineospora alba]